jgi:hypothetical protein
VSLQPQAQRAQVLAQVVQAARPVHEELVGMAPVWQRQLVDSDALCMTMALFDQLERDTHDLKVQVRTPACVLNCARVRASCVWWGPPPPRPPRSCLRSLGACVIFCVFLSDGSRAGASAEACP